MARDPGKKKKEEALIDWKVGNDLEYILKPQMLPDLPVLTNAQ